jgi:hypothetical protein
MTPPEFSDQESSTKQSYRLTDDLADELSLTEGAIVRADVVSRLTEKDSEKVLVNIRGKKVVARSSLDVKQQQTLLVRVKSLDSPIELQLLDPYEAGDDLVEADLESFLNQRNLPASDETKQLLRHWLDESLPLDTRLEDAIDNTDLLHNDSGEIDTGRLRAFSFLSGEGFPVSEESVGLLSAANGADLESELNSIYRQPDTKLQPGQDGSSLRSSITSLGLDVVRQFGRKPHEASQTLHAQLLKLVKDENIEGQPRRLLGMLLRIALRNLKRNSEFTIFFPYVDDGEVKVAWLNGDPYPEQPGWRVNCHLELSQLGPLMVTIENNADTLDVIFRSSQDDTFDRLQRNLDRIDSRLHEFSDNVTVRVKQEEPLEPTSDFDNDAMLENDSILPFATGLDVKA